MIRRFWNCAVIAGPACLAMVVMFSLSSCSSTSVNSEGLPTHLPEIHLSGSTATPPHSMASYEYPFDANGRYVSDWAAEGERRAGRSASATSDDSNRWSKSHGSSRSTSSKKTASTSKGKSGGTSTKAKSASSKGRGSYTVKKGDTLSAIAARNGTSVAKIKAANGMSSDFLSIGRVLRLP
jgi:hypothetical protein